MGLRDSLKQEPGKVVPGPRCGLTKIREGLPKEDRAALNEMIAKVRKARESAFPSSTGYNSRWIQEALRAEGFLISLITIQNHIAKRCACGD